MEPLLEIRYRLTVPDGSPIPFAPWFTSVPDGHVHGVGVRFEGDEAEARFHAFCKPEVRDAFERDLLAHPTPNAHVWQVEGRGAGESTLLGRWREPILPGVRSPMRVAHDVLGPDARPSFTITRSAIVHRCFLPVGEEANRIWSALRDELDRFKEISGIETLLDVERFAFAKLDALPVGQATDVFRAALALGYYDDPARASITEVAAASGMSGKEALALLKAAEKRILDAS